MPSNPRGATHDQSCLECLFLTHYFPLHFDIRRLPASRTIMFVLSRVLILLIIIVHQSLLPSSLRAIIHIDVEVYLSFQCRSSRRHRPNPADASACHVLMPVYYFCKYCTVHGRGRHFYSYVSTCQWCIIARGVPLVL